MSSSLHRLSSSRDMRFSCFLKYFLLAAWRLNQVYENDLTKGSSASMKGWNSSWNKRKYFSVISYQLMIDLVTFHFTRLRVLILSMIVTNPRFISYNFSCVLVTIKKVDTVVTIHLLGCTSFWQALRPDSNGRDTNRKLFMLCGRLIESSWSPPTW